MLINKLRVKNNLISHIAKPTDIQAGVNEMHLADYVEGRITHNSVHEPIRVYAEGHHEKKREGSIYTFNGISEVVKSENLISQLTPTGDKWALLSNLIQVEGGKTINVGIFNPTLNGGSHLYEYDSTNTATPLVDNNITFYSPSTWNKSITLNPNTKYIQIRFGTNRTDYTTNPYSQAYAVYGNAPTSYTPYFAPYIKNRGILGEDGNYYIPFNNTLINIGSEPLRAGDTFTTDGVRKKTRFAFSISNESQINSHTERTNGCEIGIRFAGLEYKWLGADYWAIIRGTCNYDIEATSRGGYLGNISNINHNYLCSDFNAQYNICAIYIFFYGKTYSQVLSELGNATLEFEYELATPTTEVLESYSFASGLEGADNEEPRYTLEYNRIDSVGVVGETYNDTKSINKPLLNNGVLNNTEVYNEYGVVNAWELEWIYNSNDTFKNFYTNELSNTIHLVKTNSVVADLICNLYETNSINSMYGGSVSVGIGERNDGQLKVYDSRFTDVASFKKYLQENNVKIIYKLANPTTESVQIPSTPTSIHDNEIVINGVGNFTTHYAKQR